MPRRVRHAIEKRAGANGLLRGGEDQTLRCWEVMCEEFQHGIRREVEKTTSVHYECTDERQRRMVLQHQPSTRRCRCPRCNVDQPDKARVTPGLGDDGASVTVADEYHGTSLRLITRVMASTSSARAVSGSARR